MHDTTTDSKFIPSQAEWKTYLVDLALLTIIIGLAYSLFLGSYPLIAPDEGRYAEIAREMIATGHFITPHLDYVIYLEKPVLFYWLLALAIKIGGLSEWVLRFWPACLGVIGSLATYTAGRQLYNRTTGLYASVILATSILYFALAHLVTTDMAVSTFVTLSLFSFLLSYRTSSSSKRRLGMWSVAFFAALAVLTKGLIGLVFPCMIIGTWILILNKWHALKDWFIPSSLLLFFIIALPWHILVQIKNSSFFSFYFIDQQFLRYSTMDAARYEPFYFYCLTFLLGFLPWSTWFPQTIKSHWPRWKNRHHHETEIFLLLWLFLILIFFSFSNSALIPYILPIFPPAALLTAHYFDQRGSQHSIGIRIGFYLLLPIGFILALVILLLPHYYPVAHIELAKDYLPILAITCFLLFVVVNISFWRCYFKAAFIILALGIMLFSITILPTIPAIDHRSIKPLAQILAKTATPADEIVSYNRYYQDLPFYLRQRITVVNWAMNELAFGIAHGNTNAWIIGDDDFWQRWNSGKRLFVITQHENYDEMKKNFPHIHFYLLGETQRNVLFSNKGNK